MCYPSYPDRYHLTYHPSPLGSSSNRSLLPPSPEMPQPCPLGCATSFSNEGNLIKHFERVHLRSQQCVPEEFLRTLGRWACRPCGKLWPKTRKTCVACQRGPRGSRVWELDVLPGPPTQCTPFTAPIPDLCPNLDDILTADINTYLHIPQRARDDVALVLARVIREFVSMPSW